jgi:hypothetical protein
MRGSASSPLIQHQRYAHAKQFKRANRMLKKLRTYLGRVIRDIARKIENNDALECIHLHFRPSRVGRYCTCPDCHKAED